MFFGESHRRCPLNVDSRRRLNVVTGSSAQKWAFPTAPRATKFAPEADDEALS
jgi:hypothetical protein